MIFALAQAMLALTEPPTVELRGDAPPIVHVAPERRPLGGADARELARLLGVSQPNEVVSAEFSAGHFGMLDSIIFHRRAVAGPTSFLCRAEWTGVSAREPTSPDYPGWTRELASGPEDHQVVALIALDPGETCDAVDPTNRQIWVFSAEEAAAAIGLLNRIRRATAWGELRPICAARPACPPLIADLRALAPSRVDGVRSVEVPDASSCSWLRFRSDFTTVAPDGGVWVMIACEQPLSARVYVEPSF